MNGIGFGVGPGGMRRVRMKLIQAAVLALLVAMALPASASDQRAVKSQALPTYPLFAKSMDMGGKVVVQATVDARGNVTDVKSLSGSNFLSPAAKVAVSKWKFEPGPGESTVKIAVHFSITGQ
jgi:TonB family protein